MQNLAITTSSFRFDFLTLFFQFEPETINEQGQGNKVCWDWLNDGLSYLSQAKKTTHTSLSVCTDSFSEKD